jgi:AcrR family transcriptional regulator
MLKEMNHDSPAKRPRGPKPVRIEPSYLLDAAQAVFARDGIDGGSIRAIAREAKCDPSLLYYHFENKEAIFVAILERKFGQFIPDLERVAAAYAGQRDSCGPLLTNEHGRTPLHEALMQILRVSRSHLKDDAGFRSMIRGAVQTQGAAISVLMKYIGRVIQTVIGIFESGVESGELRNDIDLRITSFFFMRACIDMVEFFPKFSAHFIPMPQEDTWALVEKQWLRLFWAGIVNTSSSGENL